MDFVNQQEILKIKTVKFKETMIRKYNNSKFIKIVLKNYKINKEIKKIIF
jgi:hypothetical protein